MAERPTIAPARDSAGAPKVQTVNDLLRAPATLKRFESFTPKFMSHERLYKVAVMAVHNNPKLGQANPVELLRAMMGVTGLGLEINSPMHHCALVPYQQGNSVKIEIIIEYPGMLELAYRSGKVLMVNADVATEEEVAEGLFKYEKGTERFLKHVYSQIRDESKDKPAYAWAMYEREGKIVDFVVLPWSKVLRSRASSSGYRNAKSKGEDSTTYKKNPWVAEEFEMGKKTAIRALYKLMPKSSEMAEALTIDEGMERDDFDLGTVVNLDASEWKVPDPKPEEEPEKKPEPKKPAKAKAKAKPKEEKPKDEERAEDEGDPRPSPPDNLPANGDTPGAETAEQSGDDGTEGEGGGESEDAGFAWGGGAVI